MRSVMAFLAIALIAAAASAQLSDDAKVRALEKFEKYFKSREISDRIEQVEHLAFIDGPKATALLMKHGLLDSSVRVRGRTAWAMSRKEDKAAIELIRTEGITSSKAFTSMTSKAERDGMTDRCNRPMWAFGTAAKETPGETDSECLARPGVGPSGSAPCPTSRKQRRPKR